MSIRLTCDSCRSVFHVKEDRAGKRGRCPQCQAFIDVPVLADREPEGTPSPRADKPASQAELMQALLQAFAGEFPRPKTTVAYRVGVLLVTAVMLLLPVIYVGLIGGFLALLYWHATAHTGLLHVHGFLYSAVWSVVFLYAGPLIAGGMLVLFMLKPLFAGRGRLERSRPLNPGREPVLFAFVTRVARAVGAPEPKRIEVDWSVNASASLGNGVAALFGHDLVLTLGLPLAGGLSVEELAAVLAHELGHFAQGAGMRLWVATRAINGWFFRAVYQRDSLDDQLAEWCAEGDRLALIFLLASIAIALTRGVLWLFMVLGHALSCFLSRHMEFDADRCATRLIGSAAYVRAARKIHIMMAAEGGFQQLFLESIRTGAHLRDLPSAIVDATDQMPPRIRRKIEKSLKGESTSLFDTHPAFPARMTSVRAEKAPGIFHCDRPAADLFSDYGKLARKVTEDLYRKALRHVEP